MRATFLTGASLLRMGRSGMRWSREGGRRILDFRTYVKSARWESFWAQYKQLATPA